MFGIICTVVVVASVVWGYSLFKRYAPESYVVDNGTSSTTVNTTTGETTPGSKMFTMADVSTHTTAASCYSVIQGSVYDLTMWVNAHPGGKSAILSLCGIDGTEKFMNQHHGGKKFMDILSRFKIGTLTQ